jgi:hypothetical protein
LYQGAKITLEIVTCDHFSSLSFGREDEVIVEMQEALKKSQGILEGRAVDHLIQNYNQDEIVLQEKKAVDDMVCFSGEWTQEERKVLKLASLPIDIFLKTLFNYYTKWSDFIAKDASCRCGFQISVSHITIQHLTVYFASRGGTGNLGKKRSAATRAKCQDEQGEDGQEALRRTPCQDRSHKSTPLRQLQQQWQARLNLEELMKNEENARKMRLLKETSGSG